MAHVMTPLCSAQTMMKEGEAVVQEGKKRDAETNENPSQVSGESRGPKEHRIALTRPHRYGWKCVACGERSTDIRHVCQVCLSPEPGYCNNVATTSSSRDSSSAAKSKKKTVEGLLVLRPGNSEDVGVRVLQTSLTKRAYRVFTESHTLAGRTFAASQHRATAAVASSSVEAALEQGDGERALSNRPECDGGDTENETRPTVMSTPTPKQQQNSASAKKFNQGFTHFVSIPLGKLPAVTTNAERFLEDLRTYITARHAESAQQVNMTATGRSTGTEPSSVPLASKSTAAAELVTSAAKLHMTLLLLSLPRREDVQFAKELLRGPFTAAWEATKAKWVASKDTTYALSGNTSLPLRHRHPLVRLGGGLRVFSKSGKNEGQNPEKASVVYLGIDDAAGLATVQQLQRTLHESLAEIIDDPEEADKSRRVLHATIMKKQWDRCPSARRPFDARPIIEAFPNAVIGAGEDGRQLFEIPELELCSIHGQDPESGAYLVEAAVKI